MRKKMTSFVVVLAAVLLALPSHAQTPKQRHFASADKKVTEVCVLKEGLKVDPAEMAKQKQLALDRAAKETAKSEAESSITSSIAKWDWAAHAPQPFAVSRRAATTDGHGIITTPDEGVHKYYTRAGGAYYPDGQSTVHTTQTGNVEMVECEDGTVYIKDIISNYIQGTWVKGTKSGNKITVEAGQPVAYGAKFNATLSVNRGSALGTSFKKESGDITFTIEGNTISLDGSDSKHVISVFWDDDDTATRYADYETVWTLDENYLPPSRELISLPDGVTANDWYAEGTSSSGDVPATVKVAVVDNEFYVSGIFDDYPESWIKGTLEGTTVTFPTLQYIGTYELLDVWAYAVQMTDDSYEPLESVTFTYDAETKTLTLDENQVLAVNAAADRLYFLAYIDKLSLCANPPAPITPPYTADLTQQEVFKKKFTVIDNNQDGKTWEWSAKYGTYYNLSGANKADDYLVLPIELEANKIYNVTVSAAAQNVRFPEKFEVKVGKADTAEALNLTAIEETTVNVTDFTDFNGSFTTDEAGMWYVAIHATSERDMFYLKVKSMTVEFAPDFAAPAAVSDLTVTAGAEGALEADIAFTAPTTAIDGSALNGPVDVKIYRDDVLVNTLEGVSTGSSQTWKDTGMKDGTCTYQVVAANACGDGEKSEKVSVYVGQDAPADVENVKVTAMPVNGLTLTWDPVVGANGHYVNPDNVKYSVTTIDLVDYWDYLIPVEGETLGSVTGLTAATVDYPVDEGKPRFEGFGVKATIGENESDPTVKFTYGLIGAPYELPMVESVTGKKMNCLWDYNDNTLLGASPDSSDDDYALAVIAEEEGPVTIESFKLNLQSAKNATLLFDAKKGTSTADKIVVYGITPDGTTTELQTMTLTDDYQSYHVALPAELSNERWARFGFKADIEGADKYLLIDNIRVLDLLDNDLSVAVKAPKAVWAGNKATVVATVKNEGAKAVSGYTVVVKANGQELLNTTVAEALPSLETATCTAELETTAFDDAADITITATVIVANDQNADNDEAETVVSVKETSVPGVTGVTAAHAADGVVVTWIAPEPDKTVVTEDFEIGEGGWTFVDADKDGNNWNYVVLDNNENEVAYSGLGFVYSASFINGVGSVKPDNWLVSPKSILDGTFKFWARGRDTNDYAEHFQVYVSTTSATDMTAFKPVSEEFVAENKYHEYTVDLRDYAGTTGWIAIRHFNVSNMYQLTVDDITYHVGIENYNIYVDGELATTVAADEVVVTIENVENGDHKVAVSVVYANGQESKPVEASVTTSLKSITVITKPVDVYSLDGRLVRKQTTSLSGLKGIYIIDGKKVVLK